MATHPAGEDNFKEEALMKPEALTSGYFRSKTVGKQYLPHISLLQEVHSRGAETTKEKRQESNALRRGTKKRAKPFRERGINSRRMRNPDNCKYSSFALATY